MKLIAVSVLCLISSSVASPLSNNSLRAADACSAEICSGSCVCSSLLSPLPSEQTPQLITLVYTDAVTDAIYSSYLRGLIEGRKNPDGVQIGATFYVPHEYTDYGRVNAIYNMGLEIAVHTISRSSLAEYWQSATLETLVQEFGGQREILSKFANIPIEDIVGAKVPNLQMAGNTLFEAYQQSEIEYDNSWTSRSNARYYPYTLDYSSSQSCDIGICPDESYPGTWVVPIVDFVGAGDLECNSIQACGISGTASEISAWLTKQFDRVYGDNRAPITLVINSGWLASNDANVKGLTQFMDALASYNDVFFVSHRQVVDWMKNPVSASAFKTDVQAKQQQCSTRICQLRKGDEVRYMTSCVPCPSTYPWLGNPLGE
ncbi:hypothetical protein Trydic_g15850 [Trypoxylus dichotomus]